MIIDTPGQVTCWQQRADPEAEANLSKRRKQRPVSIAGDSVDSAGGLKQIKRTPSMGSLVIPEDGVMHGFTTLRLYVAVAMIIPVQLNLPSIMLLNSLASS